MTPAAAFHGAALSALRARGDWAPGLRDRGFTAVARVIGVHREVYRYWVIGEVDPGSTRIADWCAALEAAGYGRIVVTIGPEGATAALTVG